MIKFVIVSIALFRANWFDIFSGVMLGRSDFTLTIAACEVIAINVGGGEISSCSHNIQAKLM